MTILSLDCGSQGNLHSLSTKKNGADDAPFSLKRTTPMRELASEIRCLMERYHDAEDIAHKLKLDTATVEQVINTVTKLKGVIQ